MKKTLPIFVFFIFLFQLGVLSAQQYQLSSTNKKALKYYNTAELAYRQKELSAAVESLQKAVKKDHDFIEAWMLLGDSYSDLSQKEEAIVAYKEAIRIDPDFFPQLYYFLGNLCFGIGDYQRSEAYLQQFLSLAEISPRHRQMGEIALERARFALHETQNPNGVSPVNMGDSINSLNDEYINFVNETANQIILTRKIPRGAAGENQRIFAEGFYQSVLKNGKWNRPDGIPLSWQEDLDLGGMSISVDGRKMYFTGCHWPNSFGNCDLYVSFRKGSIWEAPSNLGTVVNSQWWDSQPVISANGKSLFFSSKRSGGKGGSDIWKSIKLENGKWSPPINLGDSINTPGDEMAPYLHADDKTLFFSSNSRIGLGGFDLYVAKKDITGQWRQAKNLGYPVNTKDNEINIFVSLDGEKAWISSDRNDGKGGFDIYSFPMHEQIKPEKVLFVKGVVMDAETDKALGAKIVLTNLLNNRIEDSTSSDKLTGEFLMVLHPGTDYAFNITKKSYLFYSRNLNLKQVDSTKYIQQIFKLSPIKMGTQITLDNIFFDFNSAKLKTSSATELNKLLEMLTENNELRLLITGHTDNIGDAPYNQKLSTDRAFAVYNYLISKGIESSRLDYKGYGDSKPIASNASEAGRKKNRRTTIKVL